MKRHPIYDFFEWCGRSVRVAQKSGREFVSVQANYSQNFGLFFAVLIQILLILSTFYIIGSFKVGLFTFAMAVVQLVALEYVWTRSREILSSEIEQRHFFFGALFPTLVIFVIAWIALGEIIQLKAVSSQEHLYFSALPGGGMVLDDRVLDNSISLSLLGLFQAVAEVFPYSLAALRGVGVFCISIVFFMSFSLLVRALGTAFFPAALVAGLLYSDGLWAHFLSASEVPFLLAITSILMHSMITAGNTRSAGKSLAAVFAAMYSIFFLVPLIVLPCLLLGQRFLFREAGLLSRRAGFVILSWGLTLYAADLLQTFLSFHSFEPIALFEKWSFLEQMPWLLDLTKNVFVWWAGAVLVIFGLKWKSDEGWVESLQTPGKCFLLFLGFFSIIFFGVPLMEQDFSSESLRIFSSFLLYLAPIAVFSVNQMKFCRRQVALASLVVLLASSSIGYQKTLARTENSSINEAMTNFSEKSRGGTFVYDLTSADFDSRMSSNFFGSRFFSDPKSLKVRYRSFRPFEKIDHRGPILWPSSNSLIGDVLAGHTPVDVGFLFYKTPRNQTQPLVRCEWFGDLLSDCKSFSDSNLVAATIQTNYNKDDFLDRTLKFYSVLWENLDHVEGNRVHLENLILLHSIAGNDTEVEDLLEIYRGFIRKSETGQAEAFLTFVERFEQEKSADK